MDRALMERTEKLKAVFVFGGFFRKSVDPNHLGLGWRSLVGPKEDGIAPCPTIERVWAAAAPYRMNPDLRFVLSGAAIALSEGGHNPSGAHIMAAELMECEVPAGSIIEEDASGTTLEQFTNGSAILHKQGWRAEEAGILAPVWQLPRIASFMLVESQGAFRLRRTALLSMERVLAHEDPDRWNPYFARLYDLRSERWQKRFANELFGVGHILCGHQPFLLRPYRDLKDPLL